VQAELAAEAATGERDELQVAAPAEELAVLPDAPLGEYLCEQAHVALVFLLVATVACC
jgi:hypothetical protein